MSLRFILGRAGSGKTYTCLSEIRAELFQATEGSPLIFLVPEQATFQIEKELAGTPGLGGIMRAQVLSFRRLAYQIFMETGGASRTFIGDMGKRMLLRSIVEECRGKLQVFGRAAAQPGFADSLAHAFSEMKMYGVRPAELTKVIENLRLGADQPQGLADKLQDLLMLFSAFETKLGDKFTDPDDYLDLLAEKIPLSKYLEGSRIWIDGFSGFTPQEHKALGSLMLTASEVNMALCLDSSELESPAEKEDLFYITNDTLHRLKKTAKELSIPLAENRCLHNDALPRFTKAPGIAHLEKYFYTRPAPKIDFAKDVSLVAAANPQSEVEAVARAIIRLCREEGYRWQDISVILRDSALYAEHIQTVFSDYNIPFFIDQKQPVVHHPIVEMLRSALEVAEKNWTYEPVFRYLKTDLADISRNDADLLENYVLVYGIRGSSWTDGREWKYRTRYSLDEESEIQTWEEAFLQRINDARTQATASLINFTTAVASKNKPNVREVCTALVNLLLEQNVPEKLQIWSQQSADAGKPQQAREHAQVWEGITALLDEMVDALGDTVLPLQEFMQVLDAGIESQRLGIIPPGLDQVLIASLERSRNPNVRAVFLLGVNEGVLPARPANSSLIDDYERVELAGAGLQLAPDGKRKLLDEQFLIYIALTRSSEKLYLSFALANAEGEALLPSMVIKRVKELLPNLQEKYLNIEPAGTEALEFIANHDRALTYLASQIRTYKSALSQGEKYELAPEWWDVYNYSLLSPSLKAKLTLRLQGLFHHNIAQNIKKKYISGLYGKPLRGSVSRFEKFASCPFAHFSAHGLRLKKRAQRSLAAPDLGQFFHAALKMIADLIEEHDLDWAELSKDECQQLTATAVTLLEPRLQNEILLSSSRMRHVTRKLSRTVERAMLTLVRHAARGDFRPVGLEIGFGSGEALPPLKVQLPDGSHLEMSGRIDRIDKATKDGTDYLRIIDYKSGAAALKIQDILLGTKLQLLTYLDVALANAKDLFGSEAKPAAMLYFPVLNPIIEVRANTDAAQIEDKILKKMKTQGLVTSDLEVLRMMDKESAKASSLIPVTFSKDGLAKSSKSAIPVKQFAILRELLHHNLACFGERISEGEVEISPYSLDKKTACQYCIYKPLCQFDLLLADNKFRQLRKMDEAGAWQEIFRLFNIPIEKEGEADE